MGSSSGASRLRCLPLRYGLGIPEALPRYVDASMLTKSRDDEVPAVWLPSDDVATCEGLLAGRVASRSTLASREDEVIGPKPCPPGVLSVVCWPASVAGTIDIVKRGRVPKSLGDMA